MKNLSLAIGLVSLGYAACFAGPPLPKFQKLQLTDQFYCEGAYYGDFNKDGKLDVVSGPYWYEGPSFQKKHEIFPPKAFDPKKYSDNFLTFTGDFNGDGWTDILYIPTPSGDAYWYENPAGKEGPWNKHFALKDVGNESPMWGDINGDGLKDIVTGKRFWAHGPKGDVEPDAPAVVYWFELKRDKEKGVQFIPHMIDDDSGVGTQVTAVDLNGDSVPDIIVGNKKGTFLHLSQPRK